jgi:hypothetical protein
MRDELARELPMRHEKYELDVKKAAGGTNGDGTAHACQDLRGKVVQIGGVFDATVQVQASIDGAEFVNVGAAKTQGGYVELGDTAWAHVRIQTTAYVSGTPTATLAGHNSRTV